MCPAITHPAIVCNDYMLQVEDIKTIGFVNLNINNVTISCYIFNKRYCATPYTIIKIANEAGDNGVIEEIQCLDVPEAAKEADYVYTIAWYLNHRPAAVLSSIIIRSIIHYKTLYQEEMESKIIW